MQVVDDRNKSQRVTHRWLVVGNDSFMSGWGGAQGGISYAAWSCKAEDVDKVEAWVRNRSDMKRVRVVTDHPGRRYSPHRAYLKDGSHLHIYVVEPGHPALGE